MSKKPDIEYATHEEIVTGNARPLDRTMLVFSIGEKRYLNRKALAAAVLSWRAQKFKPTTAVTIHFGGYDDDPRELWDIPEAASFIRRFCEKTKAHKHPALEPISRALLLACGADPNLRVTVDMISTEAALQKSGEFYKSRIGKEET